MNRIKKSTSVILAALMLMALAVGPAMAEARQGAQPPENGFFGQVTQIDGSTITIALASMGEPGGQAPQGAPSSDGSGQAPQGAPPSDGSGQAPQGAPSSDGSGQAPQGAPSSDGSGQAPQGNPPSDGQGRGFNGSLTLTGETLTFTVTDATQITLRGGRDEQDAQGSLSDIQVGAVVTVVLDGDIAAAITVRRMPETPSATEAPAAN